VAVSVGLWDPKFPRNVGTAVRALSCFGHKNLWVDGDRVKLEPAYKKGAYRLPREERMRGGNAINVQKTGRLIDAEPSLTPVAVELVPGAEMLPYFEHPENALYIFGPEDGSLSAGILSACHRFVQVPMLHCANLASTIYLTLYDRHCKEVLAGRAAPLTLKPENWAEESPEVLA
jgi:tRNA(Leu) C34 or U34 (ribose-2'-O)-methylase TrmL